MSNELGEIRLNKYYATQSIAEYEGEPNKESTPIINRRTIRTPELISKLKKSPSLNSEANYKVNHLFPPNCRYYEEHEGGMFVVIEEEPAFRTICIDKDMASEYEALRSAGHTDEYGLDEWKKENPKKPYMFTLAMPYVVFFLSFTKNFDLLTGKVFFRSQPISGFSDILFKAPFLNISDSQSICFGDQSHKGPKRSIFADTNHIISSFWSTIFNPDYIYNYVAYQNTPALCDYITWQHYSNKDPMFIYTADWIPEPKITVGSICDELRDRLFDRQERHIEPFEYHTLEQLFRDSNEKDIVDVPGIKGAKEPLLFDVCQGMTLDDNLMVAVGDSFKNIAGQMMFVDSFLGFRKMIDPTYINLQREDGKLFKVRLTKEVRSFIAEQVKKERHLTTIELPNGLILKAGDILSLKNQYGHDIYRKVYYIRKSVTGEAEARVGSEYYIVSNIDMDAKIIDVSNPEYYEMTLTPGTDYIVIRGNSLNPCPIIATAIAEFKEVTTGRNNELVIKLVESNGMNKGHAYKIPMNQISSANRPRDIYPVDSVVELPDVFNIGRKLQWPRITTPSGGVPGKAYAMPELGIMLNYGTNLKHAGPSVLNRAPLVVDNKFSISSFNSNIEFEIGDKVVVANWDNPIDMLTVKQIQGFVENKETGNIDFAMTDKNENLYTHRYVDARHYAVKIGSVRKITNTWEDLTAGMKIIANTAGISMFPKKDANIIVGFLYDTGGPEPLVLCSNACTLWYSDVIEKFDIIKMDDPAWQNKTHAPISPSKMRIQAGDLLNGKRDYKTHFGYLVYRPRESRTVRAAHLSYYSSYDEGYAFDRRFTRDVMFDSFLSPRLTVAQENKMGWINVFPNFHGMYTVTAEFHSPYKVANDPRSILNVSSDSE
jgi:hypothetical protein